MYKLETPDKYTVYCVDEVDIYDIVEQSLFVTAQLYNSLFIFDLFFLNYQKNLIEFN